MVERIWVEVNTRINYPVKAALFELVERGLIDLGNELHKNSVPWFALNVIAPGINLFVACWNNHPIPG